jgi:hypothetical protein
MKKHNEITVSGERRIAAFWAKVATTADPSGCWEWQGYIAKDGYGHASMRKNGKSIPAPAHRVAYYLSTG